MARFLPQIKAVSRSLSLVILLAFGVESALLPIHAVEHAVQNVIQNTASPHQSAHHVDLLSAPHCELCDAWISNGHLLLLPSASISVDVLIEKSSSLASQEVSHRSLYLPPARAPPQFA